MPNHSRFQSHFFGLTPATITPFRVARIDSAPRIMGFPIFPPCGEILCRDRIILIRNGIALSRSGTILRRPQSVPPGSGFALCRRRIVLSGNRIVPRHHWIVPRRR